MGMLQLGLDLPLIENPLNFQKALFCQFVLYEILQDLRPSLLPLPVQLFLIISVVFAELDKLEEFIVGEDQVLHHGNLVVRELGSDELEFQQLLPVAQLVREGHLALTAFLLFVLAGEKHLVDGKLIPWIVDVEELFILHCAVEDFLLLVLELLVGSLVLHVHTVWWHFSAPVRPLSAVGNKALELELIRRLEDLLELQGRWLLDQFSVPCVPDAFTTMGEIGFLEDDTSTSNGI